MGCCENKSSMQSRETIVEKLKESVKNGNIKQLCFHLISYESITKTKLDIDGFVFKYQDVADLNLMGYALLHGNLEMVKYIHLKLKASIVAMDKLFRDLNLTSLTIMCENNYFEIFEYIAPFYFEIQEEEGKIELIESKEHIVQYSPVQLACYYGNIGIVSSIMQFTKGKTVPEQLDIHKINESTGENCALVSCKSGNYNMIKFLHLNCQADFSALNNAKENALQILALSANPSNLNQVFQSFVYLIEKTEVDVLYNYKDTIRKLSQEKLLFYYLIQLEAKKISVSEEELSVLASEGKLIKRPSNDILVLRTLFPENSSQFDYSIASRSSNGTAPNIWK